MPTARDNTSAPRRPPGGTFERPWGRAGYLFASPWLVGFLGLTALPMLASLLLSLTRWDGLNVATIRWVGADNYRHAADDPLVYRALWNTFFYSILAVPLGLAVALGLALLLNQRVRGMAFFRTVFFMPHVVGGVATTMMWLWIFNPDFGLLNAGLRALARPLVAARLVDRAWQPPGWLYDAAWAKPALVVMGVWGCGGAMLIFLAALQNVPESLYEAAKIDGAGRWRQFRHVTVPQISPAIFFNLVMGIIGSFQVFNEAYVITAGGTGGGPQPGGPRNSLLFVVLYVYQKGFVDFDMGYASALAWALFVIILALTMLVVRSGRAWVYYEGDAR